MATSYDTTDVKAALRNFPTIERTDKINTTASPQEAATLPSAQRRESSEVSAAASRALSSQHNDLAPTIGTSPQSKLNALHPYGQSLTLKDVASCVELESAAFANPDHRCTADKFTYRLTVCPELCSGLFISAEPDSPNAQVPTAASADTPVTGASRKQILIAHAIATKTTNRTIRDEDMRIPPDWPTRSTLPDAEGGGHKEHGTTIALHSLAVLPAFQRLGIGRLVLRDFISRMYDQKVGERIAIITYKDMVPYYERFGFENLGESGVNFGGGGWYDMQYDLSFEGA